MRNIIVSTLAIVLSLGAAAETATAPGEFRGLPGVQVVDPLAFRILAGAPDSHAAVYVGGPEAKAEAEALRQAKDYRLTYVSGNVSHDTPSADVAAETYGRTLFVESRESAKSLHAAVVQRKRELARAGSVLVVIGQVGSPFGRTTIKMFKMSPDGKYIVPLQLPFAGTSERNANAGDYLYHCRTGATQLQPDLLADGDSNNYCVVFRNIRGANFPRAVLIEDIDAAINQTSEKANRGVGLAWGIVAEDTGRLQPPTPDGQLTSMRMLDAKQLVVVDPYRRRVVARAPLDEQDPRKVNENRYFVAAEADACSFRQDVRACRNLVSVWRQE